jgi:hypothetical protein
MAIRFTEKPAGEPTRKPAAQVPAGDDAQATGEARFATPIEAVKPVNPDAAAELPFGDLPRAEKAERKKRAPRAAARK